MQRCLDATERIRRVRSLAEFKAKEMGTNKNVYSRSNEVAIGVEYGAIISTINECCVNPAEPVDPNYAAYFTVEEGKSAIMANNMKLPVPISSRFNIAASEAFTIEWYLTDVDQNIFQNRRIFSFGTNYAPGDGMPDDVAFACFLEEGGIYITINNTTYPLGNQQFPYNPFNGNPFTQNHFAIVRGAGTPNIYVYLNGGIVGDFLYSGAIPITLWTPTLTIRNETTASQKTQFYGKLPAFRWTSKALYFGEPPITPAPLPFIPDPEFNVLTINNFPTTSTPVTIDGCTITRFDAPTS